MFDPNKPRAHIPDEREIESAIAADKTHMSCHRCRHKNVCRFIDRLDAVCNTINGAYYDDPDIEPHENGDKPMTLLVRNGIAEIIVRCRHYDAGKRD